MKVNICDDCHYVYGKETSQCPNCGLQKIVPCHSKNCHTVVEGNQGTKCDKCKKGK